MHKKLGIIQKGAKIKKAGTVRTLGVKALRHAPHELAVCLARGGLDLLARRVWVAVCDVGRNSTSEQNGVLRRKNQPRARFLEERYNILACGTTPMI